jgi:PAS domain S-box-containing protein
MVETDPTPIRIDDWRWVVDAMPQLVWVADRAGKILYFNRQVDAFEGVVENDAGVWEWAAAIHPDDAKRSARAWRSALETGAPFLVEHRLKVSDGEYRWHVSHAESTPLGDGVLGWLGIVTDIHDQKLTEQALRESETRFREVANGTPLPIWIHDEHGHQTFVNDTFVEYFGADPTEFEGDVWIELTHPDDRERYLAEFTRCVRDSRPFHAAVRVRRHDGSWRWLESWASPSFSDDGRYSGHIGTSADVSERQWAEEVLRLAHRDESRRRRNAEFLTDIITRLEQESSTTTQAQILADRLVSTFADQVTVVVPGRDDPIVVGDPGPGPAPVDELARSVISAPIEANADEPGQLTVARVGASSEPFDELDADFLQNLAGRVGVCFSAATLRSQEHLIAVRLQQALLPARRLERPGIHFATRYVTAMEALDVGGDWFETFALDDGRIGVSIGDVVGHNLEAAAAMGQLRAGMLALSARSTGPAQLLSELDLFAHRYGITDFATASCAFIDPAAGELRYACAGHPSMLVVAPDGTTTWLDEALSPPLGGMLVTHRPEAVAPFPQGSTLVAYSDGLIERRDQDPDSGRQLLRERVEAIAALPVEEMCDRILEAMACPLPYSDDVALVCLRSCDAD